jgi:hypothetical protein
VYLDRLSPTHVEVGYGELGLHGGLGYEGQAVAVGRRLFWHALSTHAPARVRFTLGGLFARLRCHVALNDDVPAGRSHAHFLVLADGVRVAAAPYVVSDVRLVLDGVTYLVGTNANATQLLYTLSRLLDAGNHRVAVRVNGQASHTVELEV